MAGRSEEEIRAAAERVMQELDLYEEEARARGERFERLDEQTLLRKLAGDEASSPFFSGMWWNSAPPGGTMTFGVGIQNPDPVPYSGSSLFGLLFFGPANVIQSVDLSLTAVDTRFPRYLRGVAVAAGGSANPTFTIPIDPGITPGVYLGNCYLVQRRAFDTGRFFDRSSFPLEVL